MSDLVSTVLTLEPDAAVDLPVQQGRALHAWFLGQVREHDPALSERLHAANLLRPFTVSNLRIGFERPLRSPVLRLDGAAYVRITSFDETLSALLQDVILPDLPTHVALGQVRLPIEKATLDPEEHPWAGTATYSDLLRGMLKEVPPRLTLRFVSPTVFKSQGMYMPLPLPRLVFESLVKRWNAYGPVALPLETAGFAEAFVALSSYRLRTMQVRWGEKDHAQTLPGFWGECRFAILRRDRYWMRVLHMLADFAFFAGVGKETGRGLGQCRQVGK